MTQEKTHFKQRVLSALIYWVYRMYASTYRIRWVRGEWRFSDRDRGIPVIFAHWHEDDLVSFYANRNLGMHVLVSLSKDGSLLADAMTRMGYEPLRGSSSRGGARGLIQMIRGVRAGRTCAITIDGPRGPRHEVKSGVITLARKTGAPIVISGAVARHRFIFKKSWSRTYLPWPFTRVILGFSDVLITIPEDADKATQESTRLAVEQALHDLHEELRTYL